MTGTDFDKTSAQEFAATIRRKLPPNKKVFVHFYPEQNRRYLAILHNGKTVARIWDVESAVSYWAGL